MKKTVAIVSVLGLLLVVASLLAWYYGGTGVSAEDQAASSDPRQRSAAAERLGKTGGRQPLGTLQRLVRDKDEWVAAKAVRSIGQNHTPERRELLTKMLHDKSLSGAARGEAAAALAGFQDADPRVLASVLNKEGDPKVRRGAARGLVEMKKPETIPQLVQALSDPDERVRAYAIAAIHNMIVRRFEFDPKKPPETQQQVVERLKAYLKRCGVL